MSEQNASIERQRAFFIQEGIEEMLVQPAFLEECLLHMPPWETAHEAIHGLKILNEDHSFARMHGLTRPAHLWMENWNEIQENLQKDSILYCLCDQHSDKTAISKDQVDADTSRSLIEHHDIPIILSADPSCPYANAGLLLTDRGGWHTEDRQKLLQKFDKLLSDGQQELKGEISSQVARHTSLAIQSIAHREVFEPAEAWKPENQKFQQNLFSAIKDELNSTYAPLRKNLIRAYFLDASYWIKMNLKDFIQTVSAYAEAQKPLLNERFFHCVHSGILKLLK